MNPVPSVMHLVPREYTEGCTAWRVWSPLRHLAPIMRAAWAYNDEADAAALADNMITYDMLVYQRLGWDNLDDARMYMDTWRRAGKVTIQECDDDMWLARDEQKSHAEMGLDVPERTNAQNQDSTRLYDGVLVSTERLRSVVASFAPDLPCQVVGNYIDVDLWREWLAMYDRLPQFKNVVTVGWAGGNRHSADLAVMAEAWLRLAQARPDVHFIVQGYLDPVIRSAVPADRLHVLEWLPIRPTETKPFYGVGLKNVDVMCCSVADTLFNAAKTPIKWMEATLAGAACVVSAPLYGPVVEHGRTGYIATTADEWYTHLEKLTRKPRLRSRINAAARQRINERHAMATNVWRWPAAWAELYAAAMDKRRAPRVLVPGEREVVRV